MRDATQRPPSDKQSAVPAQPGRPARRVVQLPPFGRRGLGGDRAAGKSRRRGSYVERRIERVQVSRDMAARGDGCGGARFRDRRLRLLGALALSAVQACGPIVADTPAAAKNLPLGWDVFPLPRVLSVMKGPHLPIAAAAQAPVLHKLNAAAALLTVLVVLGAGRGARDRLRAVAAPLAPQLDLGPPAAGAAGADRRPSRRRGAGAGSDGETARGLHRRYSRHLAGASRPISRTAAPAAIAMPPPPSVAACSTRCAAATQSAARGSSVPSSRACRSAAPTAASWRWSAAAPPARAATRWSREPRRRQDEHVGAMVVDYVTRSSFGAVVMEAKNDRALREAAEAAAAARGVAFHLFSPDGPSGYDPLGHGSVDERSERLIAVENWGSADAGFYRQAASPFLRLVLRVLDAGTEPVTLASVAHHCVPDELVNLASRGGDAEVIAEVHQTIAALQGDQLRAPSRACGRVCRTSPPPISRAPGSTPPTAPRASTCARRSPGARSSTFASTPTAPATSAGRSPRWSCSTSAPPPAP